MSFRLYLQEIIRSLWERGVDGSLILMAQPSEPKTMSHRSRLWSHSVSTGMTRIRKRARCYLMPWWSNSCVNGRMWRTGKRSGSLACEKIPIRQGRSLPSQTRSRCIRMNQPMSRFSKWIERAFSVLGIVPSWFISLSCAAWAIQLPRSSTRIGSTSWVSC